MSTSPKVSKHAPPDWHPAIVETHAPGLTPHKLGASILAAATGGIGTLYDDFDELAEAASQLSPKASPELREKFRAVSEKIYTRASLRHQDALDQIARATAALTAEAAQVIRSDGKHSAEIRSHLAKVDPGEREKLIRRAIETQDRATIASGLMSTDEQTAYRDLALQQWAPDVANALIETRRLDARLRDAGKSFATRCRELAAEHGPRPDAGRDAIAALAAKASN
jgi:hypothetical protein